MASFTGKHMNGRGCLIATCHIGTDNRTAAGENAAGNRVAVSHGDDKRAITGCGARADIGKRDRVAAVGSRDRPDIQEVSDLSHVCPAGLVGNAIVKDMAHGEACRCGRIIGIGIGQGHHADIGNILCRHREGERALLHEADKIQLVGVLRHDGNSTILQEISCGHRRDGITEHCIESRQIRGSGDVTILGSNHRSACICAVGIGKPCCRGGKFLTTLQRKNQGFCGAPRWVDNDLVIVKSPADKPDCHPGKLDRTRAGGHDLAKIVTPDPFVLIGIIGKGDAFRIDQIHILDIDLGIGLADIGGTKGYNGAPRKEQVAAKITVKCYPLAMHRIQVTRHKMRQIIYLASALMRRAVTPLKPGQPAVGHLVGQCLDTGITNLENKPVIQCGHAHIVAFRPVNDLRTRDRVPKPQGCASLGVNGCVDLNKFADLVDQHVTAVEKGFRRSRISLCQLQVDIKQPFDKGVEIVDSLICLGDQAAFERGERACHFVESVSNGPAPLQRHDTRPHLGRHIAHIMKAGKKLFENRADIALARDQNRLQLFKCFEIGCGGFGIGTGIARLVQQEFVERSLDVGYTHTKPAIAADTINVALTSRNFLQLCLTALVTISVDIGDVLAGH